MALPAQYFQKLVESCPDIIISVDKQGTITFYNDGARQNLGFSIRRSAGEKRLGNLSSLEEARRVMTAMRADAARARDGCENFETGLQD
jgi:PAS domain S-box-containing protein